MLGQRFSLKLVSLFEPFFSFPNHVHKIVGLRVYEKLKADLQKVKYLLLFKVLYLFSKRALDGRHITYAMCAVCVRNKFRRFGKRFVE